METQCRPINKIPGRLLSLVYYPISYFLHVSIVCDLVQCVLFMGCLVILLLLRALWGVSLQIPL